MRVPGTATSWMHEHSPRRKLKQAKTGRNRRPPQSHKRNVVALETDDKARFAGFMPRQRFGIFTKLGGDPDFPTSW